MKKFVLFTLMLVFSFVMISCDGGITLPSDITTDEDLFTTEETTEDGVTTTGDVTTEMPTTNDQTTVEGTTDVTTTEQSTEDRLSEIAAMTSYISSSEMVFSDAEDFATELYDNGMRTSGLINMMSEIGNLEAISEAPTMQDGFEILDDVMESMTSTQIQAFLSAMIKVELLSTLQEDLIYLNGMTEEEKNMYMGNYDQEVMMLEQTITMIEENGDDVVMSAMVVIEYIMDVETMFTSELVGQIEQLAEQSAYLPEHILAIHNIKNQVIGYLSNSLPSAEDVVLFDSTVITFLNMLTMDEIDFSLVDVETFADQQLATVELVFNLFETMDQGYLEVLINLSSSNGDPMYAKMFLIENIEWLDSFFSMYDTEIQDLRNMMTLQERTDFFNNFILDEVLVFTLSQGMDETSVNEILTLLHASINYESVDAVPWIFTDIFNDILDELMLSDYELIDELYNAMMMSPEDFDTFEAYMIANRQATINTLFLTIDLFEPVFENRTASEYAAIWDVMLSVLSVATQGEIDFSLLDVDTMGEAEMLTINLFFDFLNSRDLDYNNALDAMLTSPNDPVLVKDFIIENIDLLDNFFTDYETEIQAMVNVSTLQERSDVFYNFLIGEVLPYALIHGNMMTETEVTEITTYLTTAIDYETLEGVPIILTDMFGDLLDAIVLSNYDVIEKLFIMESINPDDYGTWEEYYDAYDPAEFDFIVSVVELVEAVASNRTLEEHQTMIDTVFMALNVVANLNDMTTESTLTLLAVLEAAFDNTAENQFNIVQDVAYLAVTTTYLNDMYTLANDDTMPEEEFGVNMGILVANIIDAVYTTVSTDFEAIKTELLAVLADEDFVNNAGMTQTDIDNMIDLLNVMIPEVLAQATMIKDYSYDTITTEQMGEVTAFIEMLGIFNEEPMMTEPVDWRPFFNDWEGTYGSLYVDEGQAVLHLESLNVYQGWHVQIIQDAYAMGGGIDNEGSMQFEAGKTYRLTFDAMASVDGNINIAIGHSQGGWTAYHQEMVSVTTEMVTYSIEFTLDDTNLDYTTLAQLKFELGTLFDGLTAPQDFILDNVVLEVMEGTEYVDAGLVSNGDFSAIPFEPVE